MGLPESLKISSPGLLPGLEEACVASGQGQILIIAQMPNPLEDHPITDECSVSTVIFDLRTSAAQHKNDSQNTMLGANTAG